MDEIRNTVEYDKGTYPFGPPRIFVKKGERWIKHVHCDGARFHVLRYGGYMGLDGSIHSFIHCSEPDCIYNKPRPSGRKE